MRNAKTGLQVVSWSMGVEDAGKSEEVNKWPLNGKLKKPRNQKRENLVAINCDPKS